jgi:radical SAM protein with 4Fe4S-binding SPASM domain
MDALDLMRSSGIHRSVITTVNNKNLSELPVLLKILEGAGVESWQLQLGLPMGTMALNRELVADPDCIDAVVAFAHAHYNKTSGKTTMGILHNGEIVGCTSIRRKDFIEGSIKETSLQEIWDNPHSFKWNRALKKELLSGFCSRCKYGAACLGGCSNSRLTMSDSIYGENRYCSYSYAFSIAEERFEKVIDITDVVARSRAFIEKGNLQLAESLLRRGLVIEKGNQELLGLFGFVSYMLGNYFEAKGANEKMLLSDCNSPYANKGMGLSLCKLGRTDEGISYLRRATELTATNFMDPFYDLALVLMENDQKEDTLAVFDEGCEKSPDFIETSKGLYDKSTVGN